MRSWRFTALVVAALLTFTACSSRDEPFLKPFPSTMPSTSAPDVGTVPSTDATTTTTSGPVIGPGPTTTTTVPLEVDPGGSPGAATLDDPYFPGIGNGGYDVSHYLLDLTVDPAESSVSGTATIEATALQDLTSFNLDLLGLEVSAVRVDGAAAEFGRSQGELTVVPVAALAGGEAFTIEVDYGGHPGTVHLESAGLDIGWRSSAGVVYVVAEPDAARSWFPANDHPSDKATFTFRITVPAGSTVAANGRLVEEVAAGTQTRFTWEMDRPMATYLATILVGDLIRVESDGPNGIVIRDYVPADLAADPPAAFGAVPEAITVLSGFFGPFPFDAYGHAVVGGDFAAALENQTLSIFGRFAIDEQIVIHELAHQWFGDSVTPATWRDVWLNEGFATYAEWLWSEHNDGPEAMRRAAVRAHSLLGAIPHARTGDPGPEALFGPSTYLRGALTLAALRLEIGDDAFFSVLPTFADRFAYGNASTADFVGVAEEVSGIALAPFFDDWLFSDRLPELPEA